MSKRKMSRAEKAGRDFGRVVIQTAQLFYQENTKANFFKGLFAVIQAVKP